MKIIIKDHGDKTREEVDHSKLCKQVMLDQQKLLTSIRPEFVEKVTLEESTTLEVFRADDSIGYAAKCSLKFPSK